MENHVAHKFRNTLKYGTIHVCGSNSTHPQNQLSNAGLPKTHFHYVPFHLQIGKAIGYQEHHRYRISTSMVKHIDM
jgi:hypothetical protein